MQGILPVDKFLYSDLANDPDFAPIVGMFVDEIPDRIASLQTAFLAHDWEGLRTKAHQLKGAGGSYGFAAMTPIAAALEHKVREAAPETEILEALTDLASLCARVRAGTPTE